MPNIAILIYANIGTDSFHIDFLKYFLHYTALKMITAITDLYGENFMMYRAMNAHHDAEI